MKFKQSKSMKISVDEHQEIFISTKEKIKENCKQDNVVAFDIFDDNKLIGFAMLKKFDEGKWFLWNYAIDKNFQNKGYGKRALMELIEMMKKEYNLKTITTTYKTQNEKAKKVYENLGFETTEIFDEYDCQEVNMELNF